MTNAQTLGLCGVMVAAGLQRSGLRSTGNGGPTADFRAVLNTVRTPDGQTLRVDAEGGVRDRDTSNTRIEHGAIGAALGAIIGGAGGAILVEGRDQLDLPPGTEVTMTATSPRYR
jgi:hypothetical protein